MTAIRASRMTRTPQRMHMMLACFALLIVDAHEALGQTPATARVTALEQELRATRIEIERLQAAVDRLSSELAEIAREPAAGSPNGQPQGQENERPQRQRRAQSRWQQNDAPQPGDSPSEARPERASGPLEATAYENRILVPDLGSDEREHELEPKPELFVQSRYHAAPIDEATDEDVTRNFTISRMEARWAGRVSSKVGLGYEIQYHPAPDGAPEELVNDAFAEYYVNGALTVRAGQFVKPFGFDIQHSSSARESPERGIFAGYFFPGQRDRGLMLTANLATAAPRLRGVTLHAGAFNGNRFFDDDDRKLNYNLRIRKQFDSVPLAIGASMQIGNQPLPPGVTGTDRENIYGLDVQAVLGRLGIRAEYARGNTPSTLLALEREPIAEFVPGSKSTGAVAFFNYKLTQRDDLYWRYDRFDDDPVTGEDVRAFNVGYLRALGQNSRLGIDYQTKSDVTFNDDELNTKLSITWNVMY